MTSPQGVLLCWIRVSCQTFKIDIERSFFKPPIFDHLKINGKVRNHVFSSEECKKAFFSIWPLPRESCFAKIRVSCQTFKIDIERSFFKPPIFDHLKINGKVRNHVFSSEECKKAHFFYMTSPQGVLLCQNKSQLSNLQNRHREKLF